MSKIKIVSIIYAIGIIIGALFFDVWGADTTPFKTLSVFAWTVISVSYTHLTLPTNREV